MSRILRQLDQRCFLGFPIWEFSFRSLPRLYGRIFLRDIVLRHPLRAWQGMLAYRRFFRQAPPLSSPPVGGIEGGNITHLYAGTDAELREEIVEAEGGFLVALGFCQKPLGAPGVGCPAGRFNHECHVLARDDILEIPTERLPLPCHDCDVRRIGVAALQAGAVVYIMTSAVDIARHLFIPTLESGRFRYGLFVQCPYSIPPMILPLLICRIRSLLAGYGEGDCRDYAQFLLADEGTKEERTFLNPTAHTRVLDFLGDVASARRAGGRRPPTWQLDEGEAHERRRCFQRDGFLYVPAIKT